MINEMPDNPSCPINEACKGPSNLCVAISSRVRLARNYAEFPFPNKLNHEGCYKVLDRARRAIFSNNLKEFQFQYIDVIASQPIYKQVLVEQHLASTDLVSLDRPCGIVVRSDHQLSVMVNEEDHIRVQSFQPGLNLASAFDLAYQTESQLEREHAFAFDQQLGYLTACPTNIGTGLRCSVMLHLPALVLSGHIKEVIGASTRLGVTARGLYGEHSEAAGHMFQFSNQKTLSMSEENIVNHVQHIALQIIEQENSVRVHLLHNNPHGIKDRILRSLGIMQFAQLMTSDEALKYLSDVRMGIGLNLIQGISFEQLNSLMVSIGPGNLQHELGMQVSTHERDVYRAKKIRTMLSSGTICP